MPHNFFLAGHWKIIEPVSGRIAGKLDMVGVIFRHLFREKTRTSTFRALQTLDDSGKFSPLLSV